ncbi:tetratricopeptide repeat protein [Marilutibacter chinensis]|uniref:Tetratricopeptide repeat protein n=1 Tax=Marilutibacter chinensis TaxID=2912247 RepID=A0ABS9HSS2_9GAMM|nr:tetratricopeptide repeat protein [Lysobacter chinensis]MCF7221969.1 tetratricopeptide repeat protein [Lysobacter chinensis]
MSRFRRYGARALPSTASLLLLAACASAPPELPPSPDFDAAAAVAGIRAAGTASGGELDVQPLRDPQVSDLSEEATRLEAGRLYQAAAERLDQALEISPQDPNLLQQRAEIALLLGEPDQAERLALRARAAGTEVGPLCRRNWETVVRAREGGSRPPDDATALPRVSVEEAARRRDACTVAPPPRY